MWHLDLKEGAVPKYHEAFPIVKFYEKTIKKEVERLCQIDNKLPPKNVEPSPWDAVRTDSVGVTIICYLVYIPYQWFFLKSVFCI